jgi:type IV secretion system protein VirB10
MIKNIFKKTNQSSEEQSEYLEEQDNAEVKSEGPSIGLSKQNKFALIFLVSILSTIVIYIFFFNSSDSNNQKATEPVPNFAEKPPQSDKEIDIPKIIPKKANDEDSVDVVATEKLTTPETPSLPDLPQEYQKDQSLLTAGEKPNENEKNIAETKKLVEELKNEKIEEKKVEEKKVEEDEFAGKKYQDVNPKYSPIVVFSGGSGGPSNSIGYDKNIIDLKKDPMKNLEKTKPTVKATLVEDRKHAIIQGKMLSAVLETAINSEIPGSVRGIVSRDVYGESGSEVLITKGSRLFGSYSSKITRGQARIDISWNRLIRTDGVDLSISFNASDQFGRAGIAGEVDNRYGNAIVNSLLTSTFVAVGAATMQKFLAPNQDANNQIQTIGPIQGTLTTSTTASNQAIYDTSKAVVDTARKIVTDTLDTQPVIRVPQGTKVTVIVNADMKLPPLKKSQTSRK